jgi:hypothetical protein
MMKKIVLFMLMFHISLFADSTKNITATYKITFGLAGQIGTVHTSIKSKDGRYQIEVKGETQGLAKVLGGERVDIQKSVGLIDDNMLLPLEYTKIRKKTNEIRTKRYTFNHENKIISVHVQNIKKEKKLSSLDALFGKTVDDIDYTEIKDEKEEKLDRYTENDLLTLFFNLKNILGGKLDDIKLTKLYAAGTSKRDKYIQIYTPTQQALLQIRKVLGEDGHILAVELNQKIFLSKKGNLLLKLNDEGICTKAILKDVLTFGDVIIEVVDLKIEGALK